jgi:hypothetical protein
MTTSEGLEEDMEVSQDDNDQEDLAKDTSEIPNEPTPVQGNLLRSIVNLLVTAFEISTSIWQKKILNRFEQFWVEIYLKNFVRKIQNSGRITRPSIDLKVVLNRKIVKDFKKVGLICGNLSYKSQLMKVWAVLSWNLPKKTSFARFKILAKSLGLA